MKSVCKRLSLLLLCGLLALSATGCGRRAEASLPYAPETGGLSSATVAENGDYALLYDATRAAVTLLDKATGNRFGTTPAAAQEPVVDEYGIPVKNHPRLESPLLLEYITPDTNVINAATAYTDCISGGHFAAAQIPNGVRVTYYFDSLRIAVPVEYTLSDKGLTLTLRPEEIQEEDALLYQITVAPMLCAISNTSPDGYLFVPSGSGALIYPQDTESTLGQTYTTPLSGDDPQIDLHYQTAFASTQAARLPVFGSAEPGRAGLCAVVEQGAEAALVSAQTGIRRLGYTSVCAVWRLRSYQNILHRVGLGKRTERQYYAADKAAEPLRITYTPLSGENAGYAGMARLYRDRLADETAAPVRENLLSLRLIGGVTVDEDFLGVPYRKLLALTPLRDAQTIVSEIAENLGQPFDLLLTGYGAGGITPGYGAGGYKIPASLGGKRGLRALSDALHAAGGKLYFEFDLLTRSSRSGAAYAAGNSVLPLYSLDIATRMDDTKTPAFYLNRRDRLPALAQKAVDRAQDWSLDGVCFGSLSNTAYSDYRAAAYAGRGGTVADYAQIAAAAQAAGLVLAAVDANAYALDGASRVFAAPIASERADLLAEDVPFYEIALKGVVPLATPAVNAASDPRRTLLKAAETGMSLGYTLYHTFDKRLIFEPETEFFGGEYASVRDGMLSALKAYAADFAAVAETRVRDSRLLAPGVHETVFENGVTVYVNYSDAPFETPAGALEPLQYRFEKEVAE